MPKPEITLKLIENIADIKNEIHRNYLYSIEDVFTLYSVYINENEVAVCNINKKETGFDVVDFIGSGSCIKLIEEKLGSWE
ncbi:hypothetical protein ACQKMD_19470 [Viridibacillus sp. NPDC096237]|uniref:hypothetical protein n=1 Tax=Viridibacillus sp. NPDC096237 TaxID=3390721 RepID=UPI003D069CBB